MKEEMIYMQLLMVIVVYFAIYHHRKPKSERPKHILARDRLVDIMMVSGALLYIYGVVTTLLK